MDAFAHEPALFDMRGGVADAVPCEWPEIAPLHLRKLSLILSGDGDAGMEMESKNGLPPARSRLEENTPDSFIDGYIAAAIARNLPAFQPSLVKHDGHMVIVGSGPSVADHVEEIRAERARGRPIMAVKGAHDWLIERGITPDLWVCMDSQDKIVEGIRRKSSDTCYLIASKVSPVIFDWLDDCQRIVWHAWMGNSDLDKYPTNSHMVGGGSTSGLRGITLAWLMGFSRVILYGFDSCLKDGAKRVNGDKPDQWCIPVQAGITGPSRMCDASMASQATEFQAVTLFIMPGLKVKVVGDGLIADIMAERKRLGFNDWEE